MPPGSVDLNQEVYLDSLDRSQSLKPGSAYELAIRERLREKGMNEQQIEQKISLGRQQPKSGFDLT